MKQIIKGKLYNTDSAKNCGFRSNNLPSGNFNWMEETLYQKKTGEFFLHGRGGGLSPYAKVFPSGTSTSGSAIVPITHEEAKEWAERYLFADDYIAIFGEVQE